MPVKTYYLDFYCAEAMLCIEVDGEQHEPDRDRRRDESLLVLGILTVRVPSLDLFDEETIRSWLDVIYQTCVIRSGRDPFPEPLP